MCEQDSLGLTWSEILIRGFYDKIDILCSNLTNYLCCCCCVRVLCPTNSLGHTETGPRLKVSSERLEKPGIKLMTPGFQGE